MSKDVEIEPPTTTSSTDDEAFARQFAIKQIEQRRRLRANIVVSTAVLLIVTVIWAVTEYYNAGGWPTEGFSQSSSIPNVWNIWIIYPFLAWVLYVAVNVAYVVGRKPISEDEIRREMRRGSGAR
ncbi:MAG TPA: 2TM domain-containing protein [Kineosporiaceae bacterium]|nr:2TM domain-containing protein [Kineosporiaceae bacterium]